MIVFLIALWMVIVFILDCFIAWLAGLIAPETGLSFIQGLDFWNWFWIVVLAQMLTGAGSAGSFTRD